MAEKDVQQWREHLGRVLYDADTAYMAAAHGKRIDEYLEWDYHRQAKTPAVQRYVTLAQAVEIAIYERTRTRIAALEAVAEAADAVIESGEAFQDEALYALDRALVAAGYRSE